MSLFSEKVDARVKCVREIYKHAPLEPSNIPATLDTKVPEMKKQLPPKRIADMRRYKVSLKGKHLGVNTEKHEIFLPATVCRRLAFAR
jgi:ribosomal protein L32